MIKSTYPNEGGVTLRDRDRLRVDLIGDIDLDRLLDGDRDLDLVGDLEGLRLR